MTENSDFWFDYDRTPRDVTDMNGRRLEIGEEPSKSPSLRPVSAENTHGDTCRWNTKGW